MRAASRRSGRPARPGTPNPARSSMPWSRPRTAISPRSPESGRRGRTPDASVEDDAAVWPGGCLGGVLAQELGSCREVRDPFDRLRGFAAFSTASPYDQLADRLRKPHWEMAENVLRKARAVLAENPEKASAYVDAALRLPFDEEDQQEPAALQAHLMLFGLLTDAIEESDQDDSAWLDAATEVMEASEPAGRAELRSVLEAIEMDFTLPAAELRRLRRVIATAERAPTLYGENFPAESLKERIMTVLQICERYDDALDEYYR